MELTESPMSERQRKYRTTYRDRVVNRRGVPTPVGTLSY
jgi:hypothetical protein